MIGMGRLYVDPTPDPDSDQPEDSPVESGRIYVGSTDAEGRPLEVVDTAGDVVAVSEPGTQSSSDPAKQAPADQEPAGNASREAWADYARSQGATDEDLVDDEGNDLGRDALREKYGSNS